MARFLQSAPFRVKHAFSLVEPSGRPHGARVAADPVPQHQGALAALARDVGGFVRRFPGRSPCPSPPDAFGPGRASDATGLASASCTLVALLALLALGGCGGERREDFSLDAARLALADAFEREPETMSIYDDYRDPAADDDEVAWIVDFKMDGYRPFLQARFEGEPDQWVLGGVRERVDSGTEQPWQPVGVVIGRVRGTVAEKMEETEGLIHDVAQLVERYAVDHGNLYPTVEMGGLERLLVPDYTKRWWYDSDSFGNPLLYHAAPDGLSYIILSAGADGSWDQPPTEYFRNTDEGMEAYGGPVADPARDLIWATGYFAQRYEPR